MHQPLRMDHLGWDTFSVDNAVTGRVNTHPWCSQLCGQLSLFLMAIVFLSFLFIYVFILPYYTECWILVPQPGTEPTPSAVERPSMNHWTTREIPIVFP